MKNYEIFLVNHLLVHLSSINTTSKLYTFVWLHPTLIHYITTTINIFPTVCYIAKIIILSQKFASSGIELLRFYPDTTCSIKNPIVGREVFVYFIALSAEKTLKH